MELAHKVTDDVNRPLLEEFIKNPIITENPVVLASMITSLKIE